MGNKTEQAPECICCSIEVQFVTAEGITWLPLGSLAHCSLPSYQAPQFPAEPGTAQAPACSARHSAVQL